MDLFKIIKDLHAERDRLNRLISYLEKQDDQPQRRKPATVVGRKSARRATKQKATVH